MQSESAIPRGRVLLLRFPLGLLGLCWLLFSFGDELYLAGIDFLLCDLAGLAGASRHQCRGAAGNLARAARSHQDVTVIAVKSVFQLHTLLSPLPFAGAGPT